MLSDMAGISFRPTPATEAALIVLMERWRCRRSHAINRAIQDVACDPDDMRPKPASPQVEPPQISQSGQQAVMRARKDIVAKPPVQDISATKKVVQRDGAPEQGKTTLTGRKFGPVPKS